MPVRSGSSNGGVGRAVSVLKPWPGDSGGPRGGAGVGTGGERGGGNVGAVVPGASTELAFFGEVSAVEGDAVFEMILPFAGHGFGVAE